MGGCKCSYKNCQNTTKTTENVHFFHYPVRHKERCKLWIESANKPHFCDLEEGQLRNKVVCGYHFEDRWFPNSQKKRLLQGAIPTIDIGCEEKCSDPDMFVSTGLQDVQILPASSDGSLFILDTDSIFCTSKNVKSFVYKNGMIVPCISSSKIPIARPSTSSFLHSKQTSPYSHNFNHKLDDPSEYKVQIKNDIKYQSQPPKTLHKNEIFDHHPPNENCTMDIFNLQRTNMLLQKAEAKVTPEKSNLAKNYLRKIKQHSRDIACIKKVLRQKAMSRAKPDMETILKGIRK